MDSYKTNSYEMDYENTISNPSIFNIKELLSIYKNSDYKAYISSVLMQSNMKWLYPSLSIVIALEMFTSYKYLDEAFSVHFLIKYFFIAALMIQIILGYLFLQISKSNHYQKYSNQLIYGTIVHFIFFQSFFYLAGTFSNQSFFYFVSAIVAISLFPAIHTKYAAVLGIINYALFLSVMYYKYSHLSMLSLSINSLYIYLITLLLSFYFFTSKINILVNNKKLSIFAKEMATANDRLNYLNDKLEKISLTDPLTNISNRRCFEIDSEKIWSQSLRSKTPIAVLVLDIDFFKQYNDFFGHQQGDKCLIKVADCLRNCFKRKSDIVARIGGEEFVIVLPSVNTDNAKLMAQRILNAIHDLRLEHPKSTVSEYVSLSIGIASAVPTVDLSMNKIITFADKALYKAKKTGRNKYCCDIDISEPVSTQHVSDYKIINRETKLEAILNNNTLCYFFMDYNTGNLEFSMSALNVFDMDSRFLNDIFDFYSYVYADDLEKFDEFISTYYQGKMSDSIEFRLYINEAPLWVRCSCKLICESEDRPAFIVGAFIDIDYEVNARNLTDNLIDGSYQYDIETGTGSVSGKITSELTYKNNLDDRSDIKDLIRSFNNRDKSRFQTYISHIKDDLVLIDRVFECRINTKFKNDNWYLMKNSIDCDSKGKPKTLTGSIISLDELALYNNFIIERSQVNSISGLPDKKVFHSDFEKCIDNNSVGYLFLVDIDNFNNINNVFNYEAGNRFLKDFGIILNDRILYQGKLYHFDADLFLINFVNMDFNMAKNQLSALIDISSKPMYINDISYHYSLSVVCIEYPRFGDTLDDLLRNGDIALHKAKADGKNSSIIFSDKLFNENNKKLLLEKNLRKSVDNDMEGFVLYYHPLFEATKSVCVGAEALLRWRAPSGEIIPPNTFIPALENAGLMNKVGQWVLKESTKQCKQWLVRGKLLDRDGKFYISNNFSININISTHQLIEDDFEKNLLDHLIDIKLDCNHITLELTESMLIMDIVKARNILNSLRKKGIKIAIDDFGTGYSSLSYFRELPVDEIKIDRSFITDLEDDKFSREFVNSIIKITQSIDRVICVEGVETESQAEILKGLNANILQGFLYSAPIPNDMFEDIFLTKV